MANFPVQSGDNDSIIDGLNYVLSGPSGLGQNFVGFSSSHPAFLTGNYRPPFTIDTGVSPTPAKIFVAPIALGTSSMLDERTWKFEFASPQANPPFALGNAIYVDGVTDSYYDGTYSPIGVTECTTTYVVARTTGSYTVVAPSTGGTVMYDATSGFISTDCNAKLSVNSATARVFVSGQIPIVLNYSCTETSTMNFSVAINRYVGRSNNDPVNPDFLFDLDKTLAQRDFFLQSDATSGSVLGVDITSGLGHVPRTTYPTTYSVLPEVTSGSGSNLALDIEIKPNVAESTTGLSSGGPYFGPGTAVPYRDAPWNFKTITAAVGTGSACTVSLTNSAPAFTVGQSVTITGTSSPSFDGTYKITAATPTSLTFDSAVSGTATLTSATASNPFFSTVITVVDPGHGFQAGDTLLVKGSDIGGADGTNDLVLTIGGVSSSTGTFPATAPAGSAIVGVQPFEVIFSNVIDSPPLGYYWYILEIKITNTGGDIQVYEVDFGLTDTAAPRGLTCQLVKE